MAEQSLEPESHRRFSILENKSNKRPIFDLGGRVSSHALSPPPRVIMSYTNPIRRSIFQEDLQPRGEEGSERRSSSLLDEFTRDELGAVSPGNNFKSSFAREVVQNVRLSMSMQSPERSRRRRRIGSSLGLEDFGSSSSTYQSHLPLDAKNKYDFRSEEDEIVKTRRSKSAGTILISRKDGSSDGAPSPSSSDESLTWTTSTSKDRSSSIIEGDSLLENESASLPKKRSFYGDSNEGSPFEALKKTCQDLGFKLSYIDWINIRKFLRDRNQLDDNIVRNGDFYNAYNHIVNCKRKSEKMEGGKKLKQDSKVMKNFLSNDRVVLAPIFKDSMKSDSGGEMESCRSSDGEELEQELAVRDRRLIKRERELSNSYKDLSEKETELLKLRVDYNALLEEKEEFRRKCETFKACSEDYDTRVKEIEHLKWQLRTLENSRKTYESATERLMSFLEQVSLVLQATSPAHKKLVESTRAEVSAIARKTRCRTHSYNSSINSSLQAISRAESMPSVVHDRRGESPFSKRTCSSSGSMCSLNSSGDDHHPLSVMTLGRKIKRSQSAQSKVGLPIVDEEVNSLVLNSSLISIPKEDKPSSSTPKKKSSSIRMLKSVEPRKKRESYHLSSEPTRVEPDKSGQNIFSHSLEEIKVSNATPLSRKKEPLLTPAYSTIKRVSSQVKRSTSSQTPQNSPRNSLTIKTGEDSKEDLKIKAHKMLRSMKCILARERTLNITPKKSHHIKISKNGIQPQSLQLLSHQSSFPGLPSFPVLAVSHTSPWNC